MSLWERQDWRSRGGLGHDMRMLDGFVEISREGKTAWVCAEWADSLGAVLLSGEGCVAADAMGRGGLARFSYPGGTGLVRRYLRGGVIRHFIKDSFLLENRPLRELTVHVHAYRQGLPVPAPLGAVWERRGVWYRGAFATREVEGCNLLEYIQSAPPGPPACGGGLP